MLATGQGNCVLAQFPSGKNILFDVGGERNDAAERIIIPALWSLGVRKLDLVILSHADRDHTAGFGADIVIDMAGNQVRLSDLRGKAVFLNFWATWCVGCRAEMPDIEALYQEYKDKDVAVIGIDLVESESIVSWFVQVMGYSWTFVIDTTGEVAQDYRVTGIPASFFLDREGIIRAIHIGSMTKETMEAKLAQAMK